MPDLTIETARTCKTNRFWEMKVLGSKGKEYAVRFERLPEDVDTVYGWTCTCEAYRFSKGRKNCKHIDRVRDERCGWNGALEPGLRANDDDTCPGCGGPTDVVQVAV